MKLIRNDWLKVVIKRIYACRFFIPIEKVFCSIRKVKEAFFILKATTIDPDGLNFVKKHFKAYISSNLFLFFFFCCLSATVLDSVVSNPLPVFKLQLQLRSFRVPIKKFPYHSRRELTIMPEECWLLLEHSLIFFCFLFFCFLFFYFFIFFTQTPVRPNIHQQENRPQLHA